MGDENLVRWITAWRAAGPELERIRVSNLQAVDTASAIRAFEGLLPSVLARHRPPPCSGLVEQQRRFARLRRE